jgi:hypothetical protein
MKGLPAGTRVWLAAGATDMRKGFDHVQCASRQCSGFRSQCVRNSAFAIVIAPSQMASERLQPMLAARRQVSDQVDFRQNAAEDRD